MPFINIYLDTDPKQIWERYEVKDSTDAVAESERISKNGYKTSFAGTLIIIPVHRIHRIEVEGVDNEGRNVGN